MDWQKNLLTEPEEIRDLLLSVQTVAVLGIKTEAQADQPAFYVPRYLDSIGIDVVPVPVYYPETTEILGRPVYRKLAGIPQPVDLLDVFRRPQDIPGHLDDILAKAPRSVWFQLGIRHDEAAEKLARAGIQVVQDLCLMVEYRKIVSLNK